MPLNNIFSRDDLSLKQMLLVHNENQSNTFVSEQMARRLYRNVHPLAIAFLKCMDGRLNGAVITKTPPGIIDPFRNLGGEFNYGWPFFGEVMINWVNYNVNRGRRCLIVATYHFSAGERKRGCWGFQFDKEKAIIHTAWLKEQAELIWGVNNRVVVPIQVGIETDFDSMILHGSNGEIFDISQNIDINEERMRIQLEQLYPNMDRQMTDDFLPLVMGNLEHVKEVKTSGRVSEDIIHGESVLAVGKGFDWLHEPNQALIVGPFSPDLNKSISSALQILQDNLNGGRIPKERGIVVMSSATYHKEADPEENLAKERSKTYMNLTMSLINSEFPELKQSVSTLCGVTNLNTRYFTRIKHG